MPTNIFVNIPTTDLDRSKAFYEALGFERNADFSNDSASAMRWSDATSVMLLDGYLRAEVGGIAGSYRSAIDSLKGEKAKLLEQLTRSREETIQLNREISTMKRDSETSWASERVESALLRERINDVAAEVARLTAALEGPNSPIEAILAEAIAYKPA